MLEVRLFGTTSVDLGDGRTAVVPTGVKPRQILEMLALAGGPVSKERLADRLWEGDPPPSYLATLESYVCVLRRQLGSRGRSSVIVTTVKGYALDAARVRVDLAHCRSLVAQAGAAADDRSAVRLMQEALRVSAAPLLASEPSADWADRERDVLVRELVDGCVRASGRSLRLGDAPLAVRLARRGVELDGFAEEAWRQLMRSLAVCDRRAEALRAFVELRATMVDELGVEPSRTSRELYLTILREESDPSRTSTGDPSELRAVLALLRHVLDSTPGVTVPKGDSGLSFAAVQALAVA